MGEEFHAKVVTPSKQLVDAQVTEVVLPAHDGECGVLAKHENFIGLLGTGVLKLVREGNDYWFVISDGVFQIEDGELTVLADTGESAQAVDVEQANAAIAELEETVPSLSLYDSTADAQRKNLERAKAQIEAHRRTAVVN